MIKIEELYLQVTDQDRLALKKTMSKLEGPEEVRRTCPFSIWATTSLRRFP